jgi:hypothetical protein
MKMIGDPKRASYEANTLRTETGAIHGKLVNYFNEAHEAVATRDEQTLKGLLEIVPGLLDEFERSEARNAENPAWLTKKMRAGWHVALGEFSRALEYEMEGWRAAVGEPETDAGRDARAKRMSVSSSNIADELRRMDRANEALPWAKTSVDLWSANSVNHLVFALVLYQAGMRTQADFIIEELRKVAQFGNKRDALSKCFIYERELQDMVDLPSVQRLFEDMKRANRATEGEEVL